MWSYIILPNCKKYLTNCRSIWYNRRDFVLSKDYLIVNNLPPIYKKDLTSHRNCTIIGAPTKKSSSYYYLVRRQKFFNKSKRDYDFFHEFGHRFPGNIRKSTSLSHSGATAPIFQKSQSARYRYIIKQIGPKMQAFLQVFYKKIRA